MEIPAWVRERVERIGEGRGEGRGEGGKEEGEAPAMEVTEDGGEEGDGGKERGGEEVN
jgi:hypothetical protein